MSQNMSNGGRVTTREFYEALLDQNKQRADMETRLGDKIDDIHSEIAKGEVRYEAMGKRCVALTKRVDTNTDDIKKVRNLNAGIALLASSIAGFLGMRQ